MKTKTALSKIEKFIEFLVLKLLPVAALFFAHFYFVVWAEQNHALLNSDFAWPAAMGITLIPLLLLAAIFNRYLKRQWATSQAGVIILGIFLFCFGLGWTWTLSRLNTLLRHGREAQAIHFVREIYQAEVEFKAKNKRYATLPELIDATFLQQNNLDEKKGYKVFITDVSTDAFCIHADRVKSGDGNRDFLLTESGEIRFIETRLRGTVQRGQGELLYNLLE
jgi:hypothetical protein